MNYDQQIYETAISQGVNKDVAKYIVAQARLESADYNSNVFKCNNNMYGTKFANQNLASKGTLAPKNEISSGCSESGSGCDRAGVGNCKNGDFYAKYVTPENSIKDTIERYYKKTIRNITFEDLNSASSVDEFANLLKQRGYYGFHSFDTAEGKKEAKDYAKLLKSKLLKIKVLEFYQKNKNVINFTFIGIIALSIGAYVYYIKKKNLL